MRVTRREFLKHMGAAFLGVTLFRGTWSRQVFAQPRNAAFEPDVEIALTAEPATDPILPGTPTRVWRYRAEVLSGPSDVVQPLPDTYLGPILRFRRGQRVRIRFTNHIPEETIVHWHGLHVPPEADGHPRYVIGEGETYIYEFQVMDRAGTYWYHPHPHGRTGPQVNMGLAGLIYVSDDEEAARGLPAGEYDLPLVLQDRSFDSNNQVIYTTPLAGYLGDTILVNGRPNATFAVKATTYRLRVLNGSSSRIYKLAWGDGTPLTVIGTDGGLLETPVTRAYVTLSPGERVELLVDFGRWSVGSTITLESLAFSGGGPANVALPNGAAFRVASFQIEAAPPPPTPTPTPTPEPTPAVQAYMPFLARGYSVTTTPSLDAPRVAATRTFYLYIQAGQWTINGRTFEMTATAPDEEVPLGAREVWEFANLPPFGGGGPGGGGGGGMGTMGLPHPMHIHGLQFRVLSRQAPTNATQRANWETVKDGYVDEGWKDTVLVMPGERVQVEVTFRDYTGLYLYHCHNLEHEDMGMMRNYRVVAP